MVGDVLNLRDLVVVGQNHSVALFRQCAYPLGPASGIEGCRICASKIRSSGGCSVGSRTREVRVGTSHKSSQELVIVTGNDGVITVLKIRSELPAKAKLQLANVSKL